MACLSLFTYGDRLGPVCLWLPQILEVLHPGKQSLAIQGGGSPSAAPSPVFAFSHRSLICWTKLPMEVLELPENTPPGAPPALRSKRLPSKDGLERTFFFGVGAHGFELWKHNCPGASHPEAAPCGKISILLLGRHRLQETMSVKVTGPTQMPRTEIACPLVFPRALGVLNKEDGNDNSVSEARL